MIPLERAALRAAVFAAGAILMALEVAAFRIIGRTFGTALRETTTVIAVFLAAMSLGYWAGGRIGDRWPRTETLVTMLVIAMGAIFAVPPLDALLSDWVASSATALSLHAFLATAGIFAFPTFILATASPIAVRLFATNAGHSGSVAGSISAISTIGSIAGSVATAFFLLDWLESIHRTVLFLASACGITALVLVLGTIGRMQPHARRLVMAAVAAGAVVIAGISLAVRSSRLDAAVAGPTASTRVLVVRDSPYHHILVRESRGFRDLIFNSTAQSRMKVDDPFGLGFDYQAYVHAARLIRPSTRKVLIIGLGGGTSAKQFTTWYPDVVVDAVEVDPVVVEIAREYFHVQPSERLRLHVADGRIFLQRTNEKYDLISVDAYTTGRYGSTIPPHMVTREFFEIAASRLADGGILHFHVSRPRDDAFVRALIRTVRATFPTVVAGGGTEILASRAPLPPVRELLADRAPSLRARIPNIDALLADVFIPPPAPAGTPLLTDDYAPVDALLHGPR